MIEKVKKFRMPTIGDVIKRGPVFGNACDIHFRLGDGAEILRGALEYHIEKPQWLDGYDEIADWLTDSKGKGLLLIGGCGTGKTIIATKIIPMLVKAEFDRILHVFLADEMNSDTARVKELLMKAIDDVGVEPEKNEYGVRRNIFAEVVDKAERDRAFLVLTTNLTGEGIKVRYGQRTYDRLRGLTRQVVIRAKQSLRG